MGGTANLWDGNRKWLPPVTSAAADETGEGNSANPAIPAAPRIALHPLR